jgi:hypothetical protein
MPVNAGPVARADEVTPSKSPVSTSIKTIVKAILEYFIDSSLHEAP